MEWNADLGFPGKVQRISVAIGMLLPRGRSRIGQGIRWGFCLDCEFIECILELDVFGHIMLILGYR
jgi:hypothetical protein